jgi:hypothetical protein
MFSGSVPRGYLQLKLACRGPASRKRRRNRKPVNGGYSWATLFQGDINTGTWPSKLEGVSRIGTIKYGLVFWRTWFRQWLLWQGSEQIVRVNYRRVLSSERAPDVKKTVTVRQKKNILVIGSRWEPDTKRDWRTDRRSQLNFNFNFNFTWYWTKISQAHEV